MRHHTETTSTSPIWKERTYQDLITDRQEESSPVIKNIAEKNI
jgi:hypothetical protein